MSDAPRLTLPPEIVATAGDLPEHKRMLYCIMVAALLDLHKEATPIWKFLIAVPVLLLWGLLTGAGAFVAYYWILRLFSLSWLFFPLLVLMLVLALKASFSRRYGEQQPIVYCSPDPGLASASWHRLHFARLGETLGGFGAHGPWIYVLLIGIMIGLQWSMLYFHSGDMGLTLPDSWVGCVMLTVNNVFHGMLFGTAHLYAIDLAPPVTHTFWSSTLFLAFRLGVDALLIVTVLALLRRPKVRHLVRSAEDLLDPPSPARLARYLHRVCYQSVRWRKTFTDEYIFFCLAEKYLAGQYDDCRVLAELFPDIDLPLEVRALFVAPDGRPLLRARGSTSTSRTPS